MKRKMEKREGESQTDGESNHQDPAAISIASSECTVNLPPPPSSLAASVSKSGNNSKCSRFLVVNGIRYVRPYLHEQIYSVRIQNVGKAAAIVLAEAFHRRTNEMDDTVSYFSREIREGRVRLKRHKRSRDDDGPFARDFEVLLDPHMVTWKGDRFKLQQHVHERCVLDRGCHPLPILATYPHYTVVFKPAGLPTLDEMGGHATILGLMEDESTGDGHRYHLGHRLDRPVSGVTILGRSKSSSARLIQAVAPEHKQRGGVNGHDGVLKAYIARVQGRFVGASPVEINVRLHWDNGTKSAMIVNEGIKYEDLLLDDQPEARQSGKAISLGRETLTKVNLLLYDAERDQSVIRVELGTGARHQIRAVLANHLGLPIVGDTQYGGPPFPASEWEEDDNKGGDVCKQSEGTELRLYADDDEGSLKRMLQLEKKDWCDKCRWQLEETAKGGTVRGTDRLEDYICLLSYHYRIPSLGIDVRVPDHLVPKWANTGNDLNCCILIP